jgi:hypothetical protein
MASMRRRSSAYTAKVAAASAAMYRRYSGGISCGGRFKNRPKSVRTSCPSAAVVFFGRSMPRYNRAHASRVDSPLPPAVCPAVASVCNWCSSRVSHTWSRSTRSCTSTSGNTCCTTARSMAALCMTTGQSAWVRQKSASRARGTNTPCRPSNAAPIT